MLVSAETHPRCTPRPPPRSTRLQKLLQFFPAMSATSRTQMLSHEFVQQNGSRAQIAVTLGLQVASSALPMVHSA